MTTAEKRAWLQAASAADLLHQFRDMVSRAEHLGFGEEYLKLLDDIDLTQAEILYRLGK